MKGFSKKAIDSARGAKTIQDLSCYFFLALKGDITFEQLAQFIPDSADISQIYLLTKTSSSGIDLKANADTVLKRLHKGFLDARSKAAVLHASWSEATFDKVMVIEMEDQNLPSKKIIIVGTDGKTTLRASVKCLRIGDRWFIGEDIRYGV